MTRVAKTIGALVLGLVGVLSWSLAKHTASAPVRSLSVPQLIAEIRAGKVTSLVILSSGAVLGSSADGSTRVRSMVPPNYTRLYDVLDQQQVQYWVRDDGFAWGAYFGGALTVVFLAGLVVAIQRLFLSPVQPPLK